MTNSCKATGNFLNVSQLKSNVQNILTNIKKLEALQYNNGVSQTNIDSLVQKTDELINLVETSSLEEYAKEIKKRKKRRKIKKAKIKEIKKHLMRKKKLQITPNAASTAVLTSYGHSTKTFIDSGSPTNCPNEIITDNPDFRLLKLHHEEFFPRTFELVKMRCRNVNHTDEFPVKLSDLRTAWSKKSEKKAPESTKQERVENQWNEVFFGPVEHSYWGEKQKMGDFLRIRRIWDSYLTRGKQGTHIPCGWVLPRENALTTWQQYKVT